MSENIQTYITIEKDESDSERQDNSNYGHFVRVESKFDTNFADAEL